MRCDMKDRTMVPWPAAPALAAVLAFLATPPAAAQAPAVIHACYVPSSGAVYRVKEPNTPPACGSSTKKGQTVSHVEFSWTDGTGADHGQLTGLGGDDHPQYLLADGIRASANGFAVTGTFGSGALPDVPAGSLFAWNPAKASLVVGHRTGPLTGTSIGNYSVALGYNTRAEADDAVALGRNSTVLGPFAAAINGALAAGARSFAVGLGSAAHEFASVAIGRTAIASGALSMVLGSNATDAGHGGSFVFGDATTTGSGAYVSAVQNHQFVVRAQRFWLGTNNSVTATAGRLIETSTGAFLSSGGTWTNSSDSARKTGFRAVDGDELLTRLAAMPIYSWNYRDEDATVRHLGPTAQDFRAAFALGDGEKAIATVDADGVSLAAIQALVKRADRLARENTALRAELDAVGEQVSRLAAQLAQLLGHTADAAARR